MLVGVTLVGAAFSLALARNMRRSMAQAVAVAEAVAEVRANPPAYAVLDLRLEDGNGLQVVQAIQAARPDAKVVMLTGYGNIATAVAAVKAGAIDYLAKPADVDDILTAFARGEAPPLDPPPSDYAAPSLARAESSSRPCMLRRRGSRSRCGRFRRRAARDRSRASRGPSG